MNGLIAIAGYTLKEHLRHKVYLSLAVFGLLLFGGSVVVSALAADQRLRLILDLGLAGIELISVIAAVFLTVNLILTEMESRTIYIILAHPVRRPVYVLGRFLGTLAAVIAGMAVMGVLHALLLLAYGWSPSAAYLTAWLCIFGKVSVMGALALLLSLFSSSANTAMIFAVFLWALGHFTGELAYLAQKSGNAAVRLLVWFTYHAAPDLGVFGYKDFMGGTPPDAAWFLWLAVYTVCYAGICLYLSSWLVTQKEY